MAYSIGDVARRLGVAQHTLRHWEEMGVLTPSRVSSGHRRFTDADVADGSLVRRPVLGGH